MRYATTSLLAASLALFVACDDGTTKQSDLPTGQAPETAPEPRVEPDANLVAEAERRQQQAEGAAPAVDPAPAGAPAPVVDPAPPAVSTDAARSQGPGLTYVLPEGWSVGQPNQFRLMTLVAPESAGKLELSVSRGSGEYGGFHGNVVRWAGQVGMSEADAARIASLETVSVAGTEAIWLPLINEAGDKALIAVWVPRGPDPSSPVETWVFKFPAAPGPVDQVMAGAEGFKAFVQSIAFE